MLQGESFELFSVAIRSPATRDPYERKFLGFLKRINMSSDDFVLFTKDNPSAAEKKIISLLSTLMYSLYYFGSFTSFLYDYFILWVSYLHYTQTLNIINNP